MEKVSPAAQAWSVVRPSPAVTVAMSPSSSRISSMMCWTSALSQPPNEPWLANHAGTDASGPARVLLSRTWVNSRGSPMRPERAGPLRVGAHQPSGLQSRRAQRGHVGKCSPAGPDDGCAECADLIDRAHHTVRKFAPRIGCDRYGRATEYSPQPAASRSSTIVMWCSTVPMTIWSSSPSMSWKGK